MEIFIIKYFYESSIKYPTDVKLLFDSVQWIYEQIRLTCKEHKVRRPRTKINKWIGRAISFSKMKKKRRNKRKSLTRGLLRLLTKLLGIIEEQEQKYENEQADWREALEPIKLTFF